MHPETDLWPLSEAATPPNVAVQAISRTNPYQEYQAEAVLPVPSMSDQNELSVIAEDEEPAERSRSSLRIAEKLATITEPEPTDAEINVCLSHTSHNTSQTGSTSASADTFHSIILDSPSLTAHSCAKDDVPPLSRLSSPPPPPVLDLPDPSVLESVDTQTYPPTAGTTDEPYGESVEPGFGQDGTDQDVSPAEVSQQQSTVPRFPSLPAPVPLHKSVRGMEQQLPAINPITPGAALGGNRTSWLKKAREAKALDVGRNPSNVTLTGTGINNTLKRKSSQFFSGALTELSDEKHKVAKSTETDTAPLQLRRDSLDGDASEHIMPMQSPEDSSLGTTGKSEDMLGQFKKTVEGFRTRVGQSIGKSLAGAAAATLAEARAAAEARVVEKNSQQEDDTQALGPVATTKDPSHLDIQGSLTSTPVETGLSVIEPTPSTRTGERLSISELVATSEKNVFKEKIHASVFQPPSATTVSSHIAHNSSGAPSSSASTTNRPLPVFSKAQPVFRPPSPKPVFKAGPSGVKSTAFSTPASMSLGLAPRLPSPPAPHKLNPLSAQSTMESLASDAIFDSQNDRTSWLPSTQDTEYDNAFDSPFQKHTEVLDEDDSWPMDEKLAEGVEWTFGIPFDREDSLTWSSAPTQSQKLEQLDHVSEDVPAPAVPNDTYDLPSSEREVPGSFCMEIEDYGEHDEAAVEEEEPDIDPGKMTVTLVEVSAWIEYLSKI